jgi:hypothetical protein
VFETIPRVIPPRGEGADGLGGARLEGRRHTKHGLDVTGDRLLEERRRQRLSDTRRGSFQDEAHLLGDHGVAVPAPEPLDQHVFRAIVGLHHLRLGERAAGAPESPVDRPDPEHALLAQILR